MKYVAIEGSSYVGKTTVANQFAQEGIPVIPEYDVFGPFLPCNETYESKKAAALDVIHRERQRTAMLGNLGNKAIVISDRSIFSLITYEDMMMHAAPTNLEREARRGVQGFIIETLEEEIQRGNIMPPDATVTLRIDSQEEFDSRVRRRGVTQVECLACFSVQQLVAQRTFRYSSLTLGHESSATLDVAADPEVVVFERVHHAVEMLQKSIQRKSLMGIA